MNINNLSKLGLKKMSDSQSNCLSKSTDKFSQEVITLSDDQTDNVCLKDVQNDIVKTINRNTDVGKLKEQNYFVDNNGIISFSKLYSNRNYSNTGYIFHKREKPLAGLNDIRNVCDDFTNDCQNEESGFFNRGKSELNDNISNVSPKSSNLDDSLPIEINGSPNTGHSINNFSESPDVIYYAVHIPAEYSLPDILVDRKENLHVYTDKEEVLKLVKSNKKARFKQFRTRKEAEEFALNGAEIISHDGSSAISDNEKVMPFKRPKTEEMIQFRKDIERGDIDTVREKIFDNPKYLVSNGDTPSILQEGSRYNALHVAAKSKNAKIVCLILDTITRIDFIGYLYDDNDIDSCIARSKILLDRYLNTPDKGFNETPLHLAVKHGAVEVVQILLSYSQCQKNNVFNRYKELPKDIICSRVSGPCEKTKAAIASMLEEQYFVPVLRSEDNSLQPKIGEPFSITNPLKLETDILSPRLEIQAYAGPMSKSKAELFLKKWKKTPKRCVKDLNSPLSQRLRDAEKGLEKTGRNLASELDVPWQEYWSFLDTFIDISSEAGLGLLENYLKNRFQESFVDVNKEKENSFNGETGSNGVCPISVLCEAFEMCNSQEKQSPTNCVPSPAFRPKKDLLSSLNMLLRDQNKKPREFSKSCGRSSLVYVERFCEVFGKRIGAALSSCVLFDNHSESLKESLETQFKHLQTLIQSYKEDARFQSVDFQLIHSRVAAISAQSLQDMTKEEKQSIILALKEIDWSDGCLSDDEDLNYKNRNECLGITTKHFYCLVKQLITQLQEVQETMRMSPTVWTEADCQMLWAQATPCKCIFGKNASKKSRSGLKRKQFRSDCDCDCDVSPRKILFEDEKEEFCEALATLSDDNEDHFSTPPSGNSDSEDDNMEDVAETPSTFIFPGSLPTKTDFAVLEALEGVPLSAEKYPNIYLWRHILQTQRKPSLVDHVSVSETPLRKPLNFDSPKSSPCKLLDRSLGSNDSPPLQETVMEPWERVTGPYSPRRSTRSSLSMLYYQDSPISR